MNKDTLETLRLLNDLLVEEETLGKLLLAIRKGEGMTQEKFAKKLKISKQNLSGIENSRRLVSPVKAKVFAKNLGYMPRYFVELALQDLINREGLGKYSVRLEKARRR